MLTIEYCESGKSISDFDIESWVDYIVKVKDLNLRFKVSTSLPIDAIRLAIVQGRLDYRKVVFAFEDKTMQVNEFGALLNWSNGFCDKGVRYAEKILRHAVSMRKAERKMKKDSEMFRLELSKQWSCFLQEQPKTGRGFQNVEVLLSNGEKILGLILNCVVLETPIPVDEADIRGIKVVIE